MAFSIGMRMAHSYAWDDKCINTGNEAKQAKTKGEGNVLTDRGDMCTQGQQVIVALKDLTLN